MRRSTRLAQASALITSVLAAGLLAAAPPASADTIRDAQWYLTPLGVPTAWQTTRGAGVSVCLVDSGIDTGAPDIGPGVVTATSAYADLDSAGLVSSHGTGVAAFLAGRGHDGSAGVVGIAPAASLLSAVVNEYDKTRATTQIADAVRWCADHGAKVINASVAEASDGGISAAVRYAQSKDVVVVAAAGNTFEHVTTTELPYPARVPGVVAVTGVDENLQRDGGAFVSSAGKQVSIAGPFSTTDGTSGYAEVGLPAAGTRADIAAGKAYDTHAVGTSYASPIVAGTVALIRAAHPDLDANSVINTLVRTATPTGDGTPNRTYGYGVVNTAAAVSADLPAVTANPLIDPRAGASTTPVPSTGTAPSTSTAPTTTPAATSTAPSATTADSDHGSGDAPLWWSLAAALVLLGGGTAWWLRRRANTHAASTAGGRRADDHS